MVYTVIMVQFGHIVTYFKKTVTKGDKFATDDKTQLPWLQWILAQTGI